MVVNDLVSVTHIQAMQDRVKMNISWLLETTHQSLELLSRLQPASVGRFRERRLPRQLLPDMHVLNRAGVLVGDQKIDSIYLQDIPDHLVFKVC